MKPVAFAALVLVALALTGCRPRQSTPPSPSGSLTPLNVPPQPLLDAKAAALFSGATRVETFRLVDSTDESHKNFKALDVAKAVHGYLVVRTGTAQGKAFAARLTGALAKLDRPAYDQCFDPGVGFRVWNGKNHDDIFVCFYCAGVECVSYDAAGKIVRDVRTALGASRPALLALSREAFPGDAALMKLKDTEK